MEWIDQSGQISIIASIFHLLVVLQANTIYSLWNRILGELQIIVVLIQLCISKETSSEKGPFESMSFLNIDARILEILSGISQSLLGSVITLYMVVIISMLLRKLQFIRKGFSEVHGLEFNIVSFHSHVGFYLVNVVVTDQILKKTQFNQGIVIFWVFLLVISNAIGLLGARFYFVRMREVGIMSCKSFNHGLDGWIFKFADIIVRSFIDQDARKYLRMGIAILFIAKRTKTLLEYEFYNMKVQLLFWGFHGFHTGFAVGGIMQTFGGLDTNLSLVMSIIFGILLAWTFYSMHMEFLIRWASTPIEKCRTETDLNIKLNVIESLFDSGAGYELGKNPKLCQLLFKSILVRNRDLFKQGTKAEFFDDIHDIKLREYDELVQRSGWTLKYEIYRSFLKRFPKSPFLRLSLCNFQLRTEQEYKYSTLIELINLIHSKKDKEISVLAQKILTRILKDKYQKIKHEEFVDVKLLIEYAKSSTLLRSLIRESTIDYHKFWSEPHSKITALDKFQKARQLQKKADKLEGLWSKLKSNYPRSIQTETILYSCYLYLIRSHQTYSFKIFDEKLPPMTNNINKESKTILERSLTSGNQIFFLIERNKKGKENVLYVTQSIEFFGYSITEIESKGIDLIIPNYYKLQGCVSVIDYVEKTNGTILGTKFQLYLKKRNGVLYLMDSYITVITSQRGLTYLLAMDFSEDFELVMMCSPSGEIEGWTQGIEKQIRLSKKFLLKKKKLYLNDIFLVKIPVQENRISIQTNSKYLPYGKKSQSNSRQSSKTLMASKSNSPFVKSKEIELIFIKENLIKYSAKKISDPSLSKSIILSLTKNNDSERDDFIPEERNSDSQRSQARVVYNTDPLIDSNDSENSVSRYEVILMHKTTTKTEDPSVQVRFDMLDKDIERVLHQPAASKSLVHINRGIILYILLAISLSFAYLFLSLVKIEAIPNISQTLMSINQRHLNLWTWIYFDAITIKLCIMGLFNDRQGLTQLEYYQMSHKIWPRLNEIQNRYLKQITNRLHFFESHLQNEFYTPIRIYRTDVPDEVKYVDLFTLDRLIMDSGFKMTYLQYLPVSAQSVDDPRNMFIINNILDDQYIVEEYFYDIIKEDIAIKLSHIEDFGSQICFLLLSFSIVLCAYIFWKEKSFSAHRLNLAEALNKINPQELESHMSKVSQFLDIFKLSDQLSSFYQKLTSENAKKTIDRDPKKPSREIKIAGSPIGKLNYKLYFLQFLIFGMIALILGVSYLNLFLTQNSQSILKKHISNSVTAGLYMNEMTTISITLYAYMLSYGKVTLKNRPFQEIWDICIKDLAKSQEFYLSLVDQVDKDLAEELNYHYTSDLCKIYTDGNCYPQVQPIVQRGSFGLFSFIVHASSRIKTEYDLSEKSFGDMKRIFYTEDFINLEYAEYLYPYEAAFLLRILQTQVERTVESYKKAMKISVACFVAGFLLFLLFIWGPIKRSLTDQRMQIYEMMRIVPIGVLKYNISIKTFWNRFSKMRD